MPVSIRWYSLGSSPRPWGTRLSGRRRCVRHRFIPTPVGNTRCFPLPPTDSAVHPHARGEHAAALAAWCGTNGSSPRPWGTRLICCCRHGASRFIPTPVGNTPDAAGRGVQAPVHPHARGEHLRREAEKAGKTGSSPRPWGTLQQPFTRGLCTRFIPTPVGNTTATSTTPAPTPVHPHARGEHRRQRQKMAACCGSSPRPWGTLWPAG